MPFSYKHNDIRSVPSTGDKATQGNKSPGRSAPDTQKSGEIGQPPAANKPPLPTRQPGPNPSEKSPYSQAGKGPVKPSTDQAFSSFSGDTQAVPRGGN